MTAPHGLTGKPSNNAKERKKSARVTGRVYPEIEVAARQRCQELGLSMGDYLTMLIERDVSQ